MASDQTGRTGRTQEPGGHYHDGSWFTDEECRCALSPLSDHITARDRDGWPVSVIMLPGPGWDELFVPDPVWGES